MRRPWCVSLSLLALAAPVAAGTNWQPEGTPVCTNGAIQTDPGVTSDGDGGAYTAWFEYRNGYVDVYVQRVTRDGVIAPGWPADGLGACTATEDQYVSSLAPDGSGGVYVAWTDFRDRPTNDSDVYLHRILADGSIAPGWPVNGLAIVTLAGVQDLARITPDGMGGVYIAWDDERSGGSSSADVYLQRVTLSGEISAGWPLSGTNLSNAPGAQLGPALVSDGQGGVFVAFGDTRDFSVSRTDVYASRIRADGTLDPSWVTDGNPVCAAPGVQGIRGIAPDGAGGIYVAWQDLRTDPDLGFNDAFADVYLHRVSGTGTVDPAWPADGLPVCTATFIQQTISLVADGAGGALLVWEDYRSFATADVYAQRITPEGTRWPGWPADGLLASTAPGYQVDPVLAPDGLGGAYVAFEDLNELHQVVAQHLTGSGNYAPGWPAEGTPVAPAPGVQGNPYIVANGLGGAITAWDDTRSGPNGYDIYAQLLGASGPTPVLVSLVSAEAEAGLVRLEWFVAEGGSIRAEVERRTQTSEWERLGTITPDGSGRLRYEDRTVSAGTRYAYRLRYSDDAGLTHTPETWVTVAAHAFALRGLTPNPSAGDPVVAFSLVSAEPASLELYDLSGRLVLSREVGALGAGAHALRLDARDRLAAGVYTIRLRQAARIANVRAAIIR